MPYDQDDDLWGKVKKGYKRKELKKLLSKGEVIGKRGDRFVVIPIPQIDLPTYRYDFGNAPRVGQGEGKRGDPVGPEDSDNFGGAGSEAGEHLLDEEVSFEELAEILREVGLELPDLEPKGKKNIPVPSDKYFTIAPVGPRGLKHFKQMFKRGLIRNLLSGEYNPEKPMIIFNKSDEKYKSWKTVLLPSAGAVIIEMVDVSGSVFGDAKDIMRAASFYLEVLIKTNPKYKKVDTRYIIHDTAAKQVGRDEFFRTREGGGTIMSSGFKEIEKIIDPKQGSIFDEEKTIYSPEDWNIYIFYYSDGANWSADDTDECCEILEKNILSKSGVKLFGYFQIETPYTRDDFRSELDVYFAENEKVRTTEIATKEEIMKALKEILSKKKEIKKK